MARGLRQLATCLTGLAAAAVGGGIVAAIIMTAGASHADTQPSLSRTSDGALVGAWDVADHSLGVMSQWHPGVQALVVLSVIGCLFGLAWRWLTLSQSRSDLAELLHAIHGIADDLGDLRSQFAQHIMTCPAANFARKVRSIRTAHDEDPS